MMSPLRRLKPNYCAAALAGAVIALTAICAVTSSRWIGRTFPGFFVMENGVVASVSLPDWPAAPCEIFQHAVVTVNGVRVTNANEIYAVVRRLPVGANITYTLRQGDKRSQVVQPSRTFRYEDYFLIFPPYLLSGLALSLIGIAIWWLAPEASASKALLLGGLSGGLFAITAADLYSPAHFFRLHILGEAFFPASLLIHLALVFPADRFHRRRTLLIALPYAIAAALGAVYEIYLYRPAIYSLVHNLCMIYAGLGGVVLLGAVSWDYFTSDSHQVRQRVRVLLLGLLAGFAFPGALMFYSGMIGGGAPVNYAAYTVFFFPLSVGYAIVKHDLFEIDRMLKSGVYYLALTATLILGYLGFLTIFDLILHASHFAHSLWFSLLFISAIAMLLNPIRNFLQGTIDRVFFRLHYDPRKVLESSSAALTSTLQLNDILSLICRTIDATVAVNRCTILLFKETSAGYVDAHPLDENVPPLAVDHPLVRILKSRKGHVFSSEDAPASGVLDEAEIGARRELEERAAALAVPLAVRDDLLGIMLLGRKKSGAFFSDDDVKLLGALANQSALSIANARAYNEIETLNAALERRVDQRTQELAQSNADLRLSVAQLGRAYRDLQQSQAKLTRAEKMAALGRLAAGIAHEMNTPLGASMTSLKLIQDMVEEHRDTLGEQDAGRADNFAHADEIARLVSATRQWIDRAATHIRSLRANTRDPEREESRFFSVREIVEQIRPLVAHRLRLAQCTLVITSEPPEPALYGPPGKLGQVLTNLVVNAIDAYAGSGVKGGEVAVGLSGEKEFALITVSDRGCGIAPEHLDRIFEEFFSTKPSGEGGGLGLSITRDIVSSCFGGSVSVESVFGQGSRFILRIPTAPRSRPEDSGAPVSMLEPADQLEAANTSIPQLLPNLVPELSRDRTGGE